MHLGEIQLLIYLLAEILWEPPHHPLKERREVVRLLIFRVNAAADPFLPATLKCRGG